MKTLKWENLNPTLRELLDSESDKWTAKAVFHLLGYFIVLPLFLIGTVWAMVTDTDWGRFWALMDQIMWLVVGVLGWVFQKLRSLSGTDILLICILLILVRIANQVIALNETVNEWIEEWRANTADDGED